MTLESTGGVLRILGKIIPKSRHEINSWYYKQDIFESIDLYPEEVFFLYVLFHPPSRYTKDSNKGPEYQGLVLVKTSLTKNEYRRIGWFGIKNRSTQFRETDDAETVMELQAAFDACSPQTISII